MTPEILHGMGLGVLGLGLGILGTLVGVGGGFLLAPLLLLFYPHESTALLTATSLAVVLLNAAAGTIAYGRMGRIDYRVGWVFALAGAPGSILGALASRLLPRGMFDSLFGLVLLSLGVFLFTRRHTARGQDAPAQVDMRLGAGLSFAVGFLSSILGIGGGIIHVPLLIEVFGYPPHIAAATSTFILMLMSATGTATNLLAGQLEGGFLRVAILGSGALAGAQIGAHYSARVPGRMLVRILAVLACAMGVRLLYGALIAFEMSERVRGR